MEKERQHTAPDFMKYQYGALAARLYNSKESKMYAPSALEVLAGADGLNLGEEAIGFIRVTQASEKGIHTAINFYAGEFEKKRGQYKLSELVNEWYLPVLAGLDKTDVEKITSKLGEYDEKFADIVKKYAKAEHTLEGKEKGIEYSEDEISEAERTYKKYGEAMEIIGTLDQYMFESLRSKTVDTARKQTLKGLASKLTMPEKKGK
mgnify:FL=1